MTSGTLPRTVGTVVLVLSSLLMIAGVVQIFAQDYYRPGQVEITRTISDPPQSQASGVTLPGGASVEFKSRYPGVTMIVVAGVLQVILMLLSVMSERVVRTFAGSREGDGAS